MQTPTGPFGMPQDRQPRADIAMVKQCTRASHSRALAPEARGLYIAAVSDAIFPLTRLAQMGYEVPDLTCPLCKGMEEAAQDTLHHRIWKCQAPQCRALRNKLAPPWLQREARAAGERSILYNRGIPPMIADQAHGPPSPAQALEATTFMRNGVHITDRQQWQLSGRIYYDGSCQQARDPELSRASWAAVEVDEDGRLIASLQGVVSRAFPQTSQSAENIARTSAVQVLSAPAELVGRVVVCGLHPRK